MNLVEIFIIQIIVTSIIYNVVNAYRYIASSITELRKKTDKEFNLYFDVIKPFNDPRYFDEDLFLHGLNVKLSIEQKIKVIQFGFMPLLKTISASHSVQSEQLKLFFEKNAEELVKKS